MSFFLFSYRCSDPCRPCAPPICHGVLQVSLVLRARIHHQVESSTSHARGACVLALCVFGPGTVGDREKHDERMDVHLRKVSGEKSIYRISA